jgi:glycosyltransferase involved in cell wall biosynthesis
MKVSIVIPAYKQAQFLGEAINSVLTQTYANFELIVVNDASPDQTEEVVHQFSDPRIRYVSHPENRGLPAARNTGMRAAEGEIVALLDADDFFHPEKLQYHTQFLLEHQEVGVSYNNRFELNHSAKTIRELYRPPMEVGLKDFVLGFPFAPSEMVIRTNWAEKVNFFDESCVNGAEDLDFPIRLALSGCKFAKVDRALNYRRHHSGRRRKNLIGRKEEWVSVLENTFNDPRCPDYIKNLRTKAYTQHTLVLVFLAFIQDETSIGSNLLKEVIFLSPELFYGNPCQFMRNLVSFSVADESKDHPDVLEKILRQMTPMIKQLYSHHDWAVGYGYLIRGIRALMWGRKEVGIAHVDNAVKWKATVDKPFLGKLSSQIESIETEFGRDKAYLILSLLSPYIKKIGGKRNMDILESTLSFNRAYKNYFEGKFSLVPYDVGRAFTLNPGFLMNRGAWSIFLRSVYKEKAKGVK